MHKCSNQVIVLALSKQLTVPTHRRRRIILKLGMLLPCLYTKQGINESIVSSVRRHPSSDRTTCVTSSPLTHVVHPSSTFDTWNIVFTRGSLAPPSQKTKPESSKPTEPWRAQDSTDLWLLSPQASSATTS